MAIQKFLAMVNGIRQELAAGKSSSTGATDADVVICANSQGKLDESFLPVGIGADVGNIVASENLTAGDVVNVWDDAGTFKVRKAVATGVATSAMGFVKGSFSSGQTASVYFEGSNANVTGLSAGRLFLSASTPGAVTNTAPTGAGNIVQEVGFSTTTTSFNFQIDSPTLLA